MLKLQLLTGPRKGRKIRVSDDAPVTIGRSFGRIRLHDSRCSKNHAEIIFDGDVWIYRDLGSANGTHINQTRVHGLAELEQGDLIQIGRILIKVSSADAWGMRSIADEGEALSGHSIAPPAKAIDEPADSPPAPEQTVTGETAFGDDIDLDALFEEFENDEIEGADHPTAPGIDSPVPPKSKTLKADLNEETAAVDAIADSSVDKIVDDVDTPSVEPTSKPKSTKQENSSDLIEIEDDASDKPGTTMVLPNETIAASAVTDRASLIAPPMTTSPPMETQDSGEASGIEEIKDEAVSTRSADLSDAVPDDLDDDEAIGLASDDATQPVELEDVTDAHEPEPEPIDENLSDLIFIDDHKGETPIALPPVQVEAEAETETETEAAAEVEAEAESEVAGKIEAETDVEVPVESEIVSSTEEDEEQDNLPTAIDEAIAVTQEVQPEAEIESITAEVEPSTEEDADPPVDDAADAQAEVIEAAVDESIPEESEDSPVASIEDEDLAHSQLDVAYIQQALADLPDEADAVDQADALISNEVEGEPDADPLDEFDIDDADDVAHAAVLSPDDTDYDAPKAQDLSVPVGSSEAVADELDADDDLEHKALRSATELSTAFISQEASASPAVVQPTPGHNPVTIVAPEEPKSSRGPTPAKRADRQRLLKTAALIAIFFGLGALLVHYINPNLFTKIAGRAATQPSEPESTDPSAGGLADDNTSNPTAQQTPTQPDTTGPGSTPPNPERITPTPAVVLAGMSRLPDPFGLGSRVVGSRALAGRTTDDPNVSLPENPDLDPLPTPNVTTDPQIVMPDPGQTTPAITEPRQTTDDTTNASVDPTTNQTTNEDPTTPADGDRLIFLVDCSGSLVDSLPQMLVWLDEATENLAPGEEFTIIYFKNGNTQEILPTGFKPMSRSLREDLDARWLNPDTIPILPSGRSAPDQAMRLALSYEPSDIYLLSDEAFGRATGNTSQDQAVESIANLIGDADIRIHGIQFFYEDETGTLESIANAFGGTYEFIAETRHPDQPPIDLLEQLENRD